MRCLGTGVRTEKRRPSKRNPTGNQGFYARNCPGCGGRGEREPVTRKKARAAATDNPVDVEGSYFSGCKTVTFESR